MGLFDFFKKGKETPAANQPKQNAPKVEPPKPAAPTQQNRTQPTGTTQPGGTPRPQQQSPRDYVIQSGDSLSKIAQRFYGNASDWQKIYNANKEKIKDPNLIHPGQKIIIP
jgi:nucleoid-associated protein YgaU